MTLGVFFAFSRDFAPVSGAEHSGLVERVPNRSDAGGCPQQGRQTHSATDALGSSPVVGEGRQGWLLLNQCPNALVGTLHDRMPVILEEVWAKWLGEEPATAEELKALLVPFKGEALTMWPVNRQKVGNVRNKDREVAEPEPLEVWQK
jgi:hypothetical protein